MEEVIDFDNDVEVELESDDFYSVRDDVSE